MDLKAVFFDWDGTLADTDNSFYLALEKTLAELGLPPSSPDEYRKNGGSRQTLEARYGPDKIDSEIIELLHSHYSPGAVSLLPFARNMMEFLKHSGVFIFIITNKPHSVVEKELHLTGAMNLVHGFVGDTPGRKKKPSPDNLLYASSCLGVPVRECLMVGDTTNDLFAARSAGMPVVLVGESAREYECDYWVHDLRCLHAWLTEHLQKDAIFGNAQRQTVKP